MKGKRVVGFFDMFDEIPNNGKYLFSRKIEIAAEETAEEKAERLIHLDAPTQHHSSVVYVHYYELDNMDFDELMSTDFNKKTAAEKIKDFLTKYKGILR